MKTRILAPEQDFIEVVEGRGDPDALAAWIRSNRRRIEESLLRHGAILFSGFGLSAEQFRDTAAAISNEEVPYLNGATPRKQHIEGVYLASDFPRQLTLPQHHEMSYMPVWPMKIFFYCDIPASSGGETPLCSTRLFMDKVSPSIVRKFSDLGVRYLRNYDGGIVTNWRQAFMTEDPREVERICRETGLVAEWRPGDRLRTWGDAQGTAFHPVTGESLWHNHVINFALRSDTPGAMTPILRMSAPAVPPEQLRQWMTVEHTDLPMNAYYGDGSLIEQTVLDEIAGILERGKIAFPWKKGDFVVLDNMLAFHGRNPYEGERRVLALLKEPSSRASGAIRKAA